MKKSSVLLLMILFVTVLWGTPTFAQPRLSTKKITMTQFKKRSLRLKGTKKKVTYKITKGKKRIQVKRKGKNRFQIKGLKTGKAVIMLRCQRKTYSCRIVIKKAKSQKRKAKKDTDEEDDEDEEEDEQDNEPVRNYQIYAGIRESDQTLIMGNQIQDTADCTIKYGDISTQVLTWTEKGKVPWADSPSRQYRQVEIRSEIYPKSTAFWFADAAIEKIQGLDQINTSETVDMQYMMSIGEKGTVFQDQDIVIPFNTTACQNMRGMFSSLHCKSLILGENFDTSNCQNMSYMFSAASCTKINLGSHFNTSKVTNMQNMFSDASQLEFVNLGEQFNTIECLNMSNMFLNCAPDTLKYCNLGGHINFTNCLSCAGFMQGCGQNVRTIYNLEITDPPEEFAEDGDHNPDTEPVLNMFSGLNTDDIFIVKSDSTAQLIQQYMPEYNQNNLRVFHSEDSYD